LPPQGDGSTISTHSNERGAAVSVNQLPADILGLLIIAPCAWIASVGPSEAWCSVDTTSWCVYMHLEMRN
jgi:hypothetical protein